VVFFLSVLFLEQSASGPNVSYQPAIIKDGVISSGDFTPKGEGEVSGTPAGQGNDG